jgi:hypothetical protein
MIPHSSDTCDRGSRPAGSTFWPARGSCTSYTGQLSRGESVGVAVVLDAVLLAPLPEREVAAGATGWRGETLRTVDVVAARAVDVWQGQHQHRVAAVAARPVGVLERHLWGLVCSRWSTQFAPPETFFSLCTGYRAIPTVSTGKSSGFTESFPQAALERLRVIPERSTTQYAMHST